MLVRHQLCSGRHLDPDHVGARFTRMADKNGKTSAERKRREWFPCDVFRQDRPKHGLVGVMRSRHGRSASGKGGTDTAAEASVVSVASSVMVGLRTFDTGQFFSASPARRAKPASSMFGTLPRKVSADLLMRKPWPSGSSEMAASVESSVGVKPAACR